MASLTVRVLGEFGVDGVDLSALGSRKARQFLLLLALARGRPVAVDDLVDALWGDGPPAAPADQVAVLASRVRRRIGTERISYRDGSYRLHYDWLDVDELDAAVAEAAQRAQSGSSAGAVAAARVALSLLRGEPSAAGLDSAWVAERIAELDRSVGRARRIAADVLMAAGLWLDAVDVLSVDLRRDPYDEDRVRSLMRAEVGAGRPGAALAAFAELRTRLIEDLGTEPAPATAAVHAAVLRGELDAPDAPTDPRAPRVVGRDAELRRLDTFAERRDGPALVVVTGEAGIGKTTVLAAWQARREKAGSLVLHGGCGPLERSVPLDAVIVAIGEHLRRVGAAAAAELLGEHLGLLSPLVGPAPAARAEPLLADRDLGPMALFGALTAVLARLGEPAGVTLLLDDVHLAGPALVEWLRFLLRRPARVLVVAATRTGEGERLPATATIELGPLDTAAVAELVGPARAQVLHARSAGHPLLLSALAAAPADDLPESLVAAVRGRCDELGAAGTLVKAAAVLGPGLDVDLLAAVLRRPAMDVLDDAERAARAGLLVESAGRFGFRHELVRAALSADATAARRALLHREAGRALAGRPDVDPVEVAEHARLGGDLQVAGRFLRTAAARAGERYDHATAARLLDEAVVLSPEPENWLARARVCTRRGKYAEAMTDVGRAASAGAAALEVGAWASYFDRRFADAIRFAHDGVISADDESVRARCLIIGGRTRHAAGDLDGAETLLREAVAVSAGTDRVTASAWLGVLCAHRSRPGEALDLFGPAINTDIGVEYTAATLHALLFAGHAHAVAGRPAAALDAFARYSTEVARRGVPRFAGRGVNFAGWVLRNLGEVERGVAAHREASAAVGAGAIPETSVAAAADLAEERLHAGDLAGARSHLRDADVTGRGDLVFGWRLAMRHRLLHARLQLAEGDAAAALAGAEALAADATAIGVPRYEVSARLVAHRARHRLGVGYDPAAVDRDLALVEAVVALEAWWWIGETTADLRLPGGLDRAAAAVERLAAHSGPHADALRRYADRRLDAWAATAR